MTKLHNAAYQLDWIRSLLPILGLQEINLQSLYTFLARSVIAPTAWKERVVPENIRRMVAVYSNLLSRGLPTLPSLYVERAIANAVNSLVPIQEKHKIGSINFELGTISSETTAAWLQALSLSYYQGDPRVNLQSYNRDKFISGHQTNQRHNVEEIQFYQEIFPAIAGEVAAQHLLPQRKVSSMVSSKNKDDFFEQRVDFALELEDLKIVFEIDGSQHNEASQNYLDKRRDAALQASGWQIYRIPTSFISGDLNHAFTAPALQKYIEDTKNNHSLENLRQLEREPLWCTPLGRLALLAVRTPIAVIRLQKLLLGSIQEGILQMDASSWKITVIERDVPCAVLAIVDFLEHWRNLLALIDDPAPMPAIDLLVYTTSEFAEFPRLVSNEDILTYKLSVEQRIYQDSQDYRSPFAADLLLDVSTLIPDGLAPIDPVFTAHHLQPEGNAYEIRSSLVHADRRCVASAEPIAYPITKRTEDVLRYFLQNIFRKTDFREKQLEIIYRALSLQPVIGLLPTGAGKSLCYQMVAFLQPGMTIVVDPIISLMIDQVENLRSRLAIDSITTINSTLGTNKREETLSQVYSKSKQIIFVSPERFQDKRFRERLTNFAHSFPIPYVVIDEAHVVSEWGHDFRTSYLKLRKTIDSVCKFKGTYPPTIIALTGTASYTVLSDIQREIGIEDEAAKVLPTTYNREELKFACQSIASSDKLGGLKEEFHKIADKLGLAYDSLFQIDRENTAAGIIFTVHTSGKFGVYDVADALQKDLKTEVRYYSGQVPRVHLSGEKAPVMGEQDYQKYKVDTQNLFKENKIPLIVATKAYGMGIDKPNIRYVVHYNIPHSLEAYYQEAGRAGRDRNDAICVILFSDEEREQAQAALLPDANDEVIKRVTQKSRSAGDVHRVLCLHKTTYEGASIDIDNTLRILKQLIAPALYGKAEYEKVTVLVPYEGDHDRIIVDKAIFRLATIGIVEDYTADYHTRSFEVTVNNLPDDALVSNLCSYIKRYKTREYTERVPEEIEKREGLSVVEKVIAYLVDFVYAEIETKRRAAIRSMADVARTAAELPEADADQYIRKEIQTYLEHSPFTDPLLDLVTEVEPSSWHALLHKADGDGQPIIASVDGVRQLLGSCRRVGESYPDHPALWFISSLARLMLPDADNKTALQELGQAIKALGLFNPEKQEEAALVILDEYEYWLKNTIDYEDILEHVALQLLKAFPYRKVARRTHLIIPNESTTIIVKTVLETTRYLRQKLTVT